MKRIISILLLLMIVYNFMGYYFVYLALLTDVKSEMRTSIENGEIEDKIEVLKFDYSNGQVTDKDFEFVEENEFKYKGQMYDVEKSAVKDGFIYFYCVNDIKEENLDNSLSQYIVNNLTTNPEHQKKAVELIKKILDKYLPFEEKDYSNLISPASKLYCEYSNSDTFNYISPLTPPPKLS